MAFEMTWQEFERYCEALIRESLDENRFRITSQYRGEYGGALKCMDFHIAEKRQGGKGYVIDCKHFQKTPLTKREIQTTLDYKRLCRASGAIILVSGISYCPPSFLDSARSRGVKVIKVDIGWRTRIPILRRLLRPQLNLGI